MKVKIENNELVIRTPMNLNKTSRSGNSTVIATTRGQQYIGKVDGKDTYLQLNVLQMETPGGMEVEGATEINQTRKPPAKAA